MPPEGAADGGAWCQNWKRRWFVLLDRQLIYYETENVRGHGAGPLVAAGALTAHFAWGVGVGQDVARSKMLGVIDLRQCTVLADADTLTKRAFSFAIDTPTRRWLLVAENKEERNEWVTVLTFHPEYRPPTG